MQLARPEQPARLGYRDPLGRRDPPGLPVRPALRGLRGRRGSPGRRDLPARKGHRELPVQPDPPDPLVRLARPAPLARPALLA